MKLLNVISHTRFLWRSGSKLEFPEVVPCMPTNKPFVQRKRCSSQNFNFLLNTSNRLSCTATSILCRTHNFLQLKRKKSPFRKNKQSLSIDLKQTICSFEMQYGAQLCINPYQRGTLQNILLYIILIILTCILCISLMNLRKVPKTRNMPE